MDLPPRERRRFFPGIPRCSRRGFFRAPSGHSRCAAFGGGDCRDPPRRAGRLLARPRSRRKKGAQGPSALGGLPGHRCAPRLRRAPQSGDAHSKRATGPLWIPRRESPCDPARRAGILRGCLRRMPGARYARRPISGLRAAFGGWPPKRGLRTAVAGAPPRDPGLSPLRGPGPAGRNFKRYPPGVPCQYPQTAAAPHEYTS